MKILLQLIIIACIWWTSTASAVTLHLIGDSTMANKAANVFPETGWGQALAQLKSNKLQLVNHAVNGRSSKSFIDEGRWAKVKKALVKGDYLVVQFGHNDQKCYDPSRYTRPEVEYRANLLRFITEAQAQGATPILVTSINRREFAHNGLLADTHRQYPDVVRRLAKENSVTLIDLQSLTQEWLNSAGIEGSKRFFLYGAPGEYKNYPAGVEDNTHLSEQGAAKVATLFVAALHANKNPLALYFPQAAAKPHP